MITLEKFRSLRLQDYVPAEVIDRSDAWEWMGRTWVGHSVGFTCWLRCPETPDQLRSLSLDLGSLSSSVSERVFQDLELCLRPGKALKEVEATLGAPDSVESFVPDRSSYLFLHDDYHVDCTIHESSGLLYIVITEAPFAEPELS
ncbi:MAG: hypothetical protein AAF488_01540 [Planctomycetota bacterium]